MISKITNPERSGIYGKKRFEDQRKFDFSWYLTKKNPRKASTKEANHRVSRHTCEKYIILSKNAQFDGISAY